MQFSIDSLASKYNNILVLGDLNCEIEESSMSDFCQSINLKPLINVPTCFKNPENPTCIDHMLTNNPNHFHNTVYTIETGLSDFHKMTLTILKIGRAHV